MPSTIATSILILGTLAVTIYLSDRGLVNAMEKAGIFLLRAAQRMRERQKAVEDSQREQILSLTRSLPL